MSTASIVRWLSSTDLSQSIQTTHGAIAGIQMVHITSLAILFALALNLSLRVVGKGFIAESVAVSARRFVPAIWICVGLLALSGALLIVAEPFRTITNGVFYLKMGLVVIAVFLTAWLAVMARRDPSQPAAMPVRVTVAATSMLVWAAVMVAGRMIAYT